jgi:hypothetical protein
MKQDISLDSVLKLYVFVNLKRNQYKRGTFDALDNGLKKNAIKNKTKLGCQKQRQV